MGTGFAKKKKQAKQLQQQFMQMQSQMQATEVTGTAANGLVSIILTGDHEMKKIEIKRECVDPDDLEGLVLLIKTAYQDAHQKLKNQSMEGLPPGLSESQFLP